MRIGLDARFVTNRPRRGIGNYSLQLIRELIAQAPEHDFFLYISNEDAEGVLPVASNVRLRRLSPSFYPLWEQVVLPYATAADKIDVLHCLGNTGPLWVSNRIKLVLTLHDVMFLQSGEHIPIPTNIYQKFGQLYRSLISPPCSRNASEIITVSNYSRSDILSMVHGLDSGRVNVVYQSCDPSFVEDENGATNTCLGKRKSPYLLALGAKDPRKNTLSLVHAYLLLLKQHGLQEDLIICGYGDWQSSEAYEAVVRASATDRVIFLSYVSLQDLVSLYRNACLFIYPSLYEGFGIPILEAFSAGCPVVASNVTSIPEVAGDAALYFEPTNKDDIARTVLRLLSDANLRSTLAAKGRIRAQQFTWRAAARKTLEIYEKSMLENTKGAFK